MSNILRYIDMYKYPKSLETYHVWPEQADLVPILSSIFVRPRFMYNTLNETVLQFFKFSAAFWK